MIDRIRQAIARLLQRIPALRKRRDRQEQVQRDKEKGRAAARKQMGTALRQAAFHDRLADEAIKAGQTSSAHQQENRRDEYLEQAEFYHEKALRRGAEATSASDKAAEIQRKLDGEVEHLEALRRKLERAIHAPAFSVQGDICLNPGAECWGGADALMDDVEAFLLRRGLPLGSGKRTPAVNTAVGGSPSSAHLTTRLTTDARDFPTYSGEDDARALMAALGVTSWVPNSYTTFTLHVDGYIFRIQVLWGSAIGHGDHVHVGIEYIGRS